MFSYLKNILLLKNPAYPIDKFVKKVIDDPFGSRTSTELRSAHEEYKATKNWLILPRRDRVVRSLLVAKSFEDVVNEFPHFVFNSVNLNTRLYCIPSRYFLSSKELKSGDAVSLNNESFEFKSRFALTCYTHKSILRSYSFSTSNPDMRFSFLFSELHSDFNYIEFIQNLSSIGIREENVKLFSKEYLSSLVASPGYIEKFFELYDLPLTRYTTENYAVVMQKCQNVISASGRPEVVSAAQDFQRKLLLEQTKNSSCVKILRQSPLVKTKQETGVGVGHADSDLLDFRVRDVTEEPEDIFADIVDLFDDPNDTFSGGDV